jgi:hypothetical protein
MKALLLSAALVAAVNGAGLRKIDPKYTIIDHIPRDLPIHKTPILLHPDVVDNRLDVVLPTPKLRGGIRDHPVLIRDPIRPVDPSSLYNDTPYFSHPRPVTLPIDAPQIPEVPEIPVATITLPPKTLPVDPRSLYDDSAFGNPRLGTLPIDAPQIPEVPELPADDSSLYNDTPWFSHPRPDTLPIDAPQIPEVPELPVDNSSLYNDTPWFSHPRPVTLPIEIEPVLEVAELELDTMPVFHNIFKDYPELLANFTLDGNSTGIKDHLIEEPIRITDGPIKLEPVPEAAQIEVNSDEAADLQLDVLKAKPIVPSRPNFPHLLPRVPIHPPLISIPEKPIKLN